jgi:hypothetical protein
MIKDTHQRCQQCNAGLYAVADWDAEIERPADERGWFCGTECRAAWFRSTWGFTPWDTAERIRKQRVLSVERPTCPRCLVPMIRYGGPKRFRCRKCALKNNATVSLHSN